MISVSFSSLQIDNISCVITATILLSQKMLDYIFAKLWSKTQIALSTTTIFSIRRKNVSWWKTSCWLTAWNAMLVISFKSSSSSDKTSIKFDHSSFINEFKHSSKSTKSFNSLSIINLTSSSSSLSCSSKSRTSLHQLVILWILELSSLWLLFQQYSRLFLSHSLMSQWI